MMIDEYVAEQLVSENLPGIETQSAFLKKKKKKGETTWFRKENAIQYNFHMLRLMGS